MCYFFERVQECTALWAALQQGCRCAAGRVSPRAPKHALAAALMPVHHQPLLRPLRPPAPHRAAGVEVMYTVIQVGGATAALDTVL